MHLVFACRGAHHRVKNFIEQLAGKYVPFRYPGADGKLEDKFVQLNVQPMQLYSVVFPESCKDIVLATILGKDSKPRKYPGLINQIIKWARRALGLEEIPEYKSEHIMPIDDAHIDRFGIGIKKDYWVTASGAHIDNPTEEQKKECWEGL